MNRLTSSLAAARETVARERQAKAEAAAAVRATSRAAASLAIEAASAGRPADTVSTDAADIAAAASRVGRELQTLLTYLTTTPATQIDSGYIGTQVAYLTRQLTALQNSGVGVGTAATNFKTAVRKLSHDAEKLSPN